MCRGRVFLFSMFIQQQLGNLCTVHTLVLVTCIHFYIVLHLCGN